MRTVAGLYTLFTKITTTHLKILFIFLRENAGNFTKRLDVTIYWDVIVVVRSSFSAMALTKAKRTEKRGKRQRDYWDRAALTYRVHLLSTIKPQPSLVLQKSFFITH